MVDFFGAGFTAGFGFDVGAEVGSDFEVGFGVNVGAGFVAGAEVGIGFGIAAKATCVNTILLDASIESNVAAINFFIVFI